MNPIQLLDLHGKLWECLMDHDAPTAFCAADTATDTKNRLLERAAHLEAIMSATDCYVEELLADCKRVGIPAYAFEKLIAARKEAQDTIKQVLEGWRVPVS